ncbi:MAG: GNAT family N-acetyltransferase [Armatimonadetes bacterium]|nr:GNAT family N-acetyltransferase [Armatimonadota bacterium]
MATVYGTSAATAADRDVALGFLEARGLVRNPWLVWMVDEALAHPHERRIVLCRCRGQLAGVATFLRYADLPCPPRVSLDYDYDADLDGIDATAVDALLMALPPGLRGRFQLLSPVAQGVFDALPGVKRREADLFYTVSAEQFHPVAGEAVVGLTAADAALFESTERAAQGDPLREVGEHGRRKFAIVRDGRAVASASVAPVGRDERRFGSVLAICGVYVESSCRRQGLGRRLVSHITECILHDGHAPPVLDGAGEHRLPGPGAQPELSSVHAVYHLPLDASPSGRVTPGFRPFSLPAGHPGPPRTAPGSDGVILPPFRARTMTDATSPAPRPRHIMRSAGTVRKMRFRSGVPASGT